MKFGAWLIICFSVIALSLSFFNLYQVYVHPIKYKTEIIECAKECEINPTLVASVINVESSFRKNARSNKNAIGLMQIKLTTANYLNDLENLNHITEKELFKPKKNIEYGIKYLRYLLNKFEDVNTALASYNAGETIVRAWLKNENYSTDEKTLNYIPYTETRNYVKKINENIKYYKKIFD